MTNQMKYPTYPIEAFALAVVLFSSGMKEAMIVGIGLIFGDILLCVLSEFVSKQYMQTIRVITVVITCVTMNLMFSLVGITPDTKQMLGFAMLGILLMKHHETVQEKNTTGVTDYNAVLLADSCAYGIYVLVAVIREYLAGAVIFGYTLPEVPVVSASFGKPMFALIFAGIAVALINRILHVTSDKDSALMVCTATILLEAPFVWNNVPEWGGTIVGMITVAVVYFTLRKKLVFSETEKHIEGTSVELVMLGVIYMIFSLL